ncbi:MAG TPA: hypothetical protein VGD31_00015 [Sphingobacteriaceae bacterium]
MNNQLSKSDEQITILESKVLTSLINEICDVLENDNDLNLEQRNYWLTQLNIYNQILQADIRILKAKYNRQKAVLIVPYQKAHLN